jgi:tripartite ATP-independent transporter DctP family solute receptor
MNSFSKLMLSMAALAILSGGNAVQAQVREHAFRFPFTQPADSSHFDGAKKFADLVGQKSGGKMQVKLFPGGVLGNEPVILSSVRGATIEISVMAPSLLVPIIKEYAVWDFPYLFDNHEQAYAVLDGPIGKELLDRLPPIGLVGLGYWEHGFRNLTNNKRPVAKLEDMKGLKIRTLQSPLYLTFHEALGMNPVPMPFTELYTAMEQKIVDGQEQPYSSIEANKFYEVQKYMSDTQHIYNPLLVLMSKKVWDRLSGDEQKILQDAATEATDYQRKVSQERDTKALDVIKANGVTFTEISPQEKARMRDAVKPVIEKYSREAGEDLSKRVIAEVEKLRGQ